jgi:hypothetical protein
VASKEIQVQQFTFNPDDNEHRLNLPRRWPACLKDSGRFYRNRQGQILFLVEEPDFVVVSRWQELRGIVELGDVVKVISPRELTDSDYKDLWHTLNDYRWRLPSAGKRFAPTAATVRA